MTRPTSHLLETLTAREQEVLSLLLDGLSTSAVAARLSIAEKTAENHVSSIYAKLGVHSRAQLFALLTRPRWSSRHDEP